MVLSSSQMDIVFAAEVKIGVLQYMSSVVAERQKSESELYKLDMSIKIGNTWLKVLKSFFCFILVFTISWQ